MAKWIRAAKGVRYKEHDSRKHNSRPDRYFEIQYKRNGKVTNEVMGWESEGMTRAKCERVLSVLRENWRNGQGGQTYKEIRELNLEQSAQEKEEKEKQKSYTLQSIFSDSYLAEQKVNRKKELTMRNEQALMQNYITPFFSNTSIYEIDKSMITKFLSYLMDVVSVRTKTPLSNQTQKHAINLVSQIFNHAIASKKDLTKLENPVKLVKKPSTRSARRERFLSISEAKELLAALKQRSQNTHDMALLALFCGLRAGEILKLKWKDIKLEQKQIILLDTKNGTNRNANMTPEIELMLLRRKENINSSLDDVFPNKEISKTFERVVEYLGLNEGVDDARQKVVFHTLRHTFASWHAEKGTSMLKLASLLGHSSTTTTERYSHLSPDAEKQAATALHGILDEPQSKVLHFNKGA